MLLSVPIILMCAQLYSTCLPCVWPWVLFQFSLILKSAVPGLVTSLSATLVNSTALILRWQPPPPEDRNGVITQYVVNITGLSVAGQEPFVLHTTETSIVVGLLYPSYTYACEVAAVTSVGQGPYRNLTSQLPEDRMNIWVYTYLSMYVVTDYNNVLQLHPLPGCSIQELHYASSLLDPTTTWKPEWPNQRV